jgi:hypothetical protein
MDAAKEKQRAFVLISENSLETASQRVTKVCWICDRTGSNHDEDCSDSAATLEDACSSPCEATASRTKNSVILDALEGEFSTAISDPERFLLLLF